MTITPKQYDDVCKIIDEAKAEGDMDTDCYVSMVLEAIGVDVEEEHADHAEEEKMTKYTFHDLATGKIPQKIEQRLEHLRSELRAERISYGELAELESLKDHIDPGDVELLEAAGVPEFSEEER